jgi:hypothetical protein
MSMASCRVSTPELVKILPLTKSVRDMIAVQASAVSVLVVVSGQIHSRGPYMIV